MCDKFAHLSEKTCIELASSDKIENIIIALSKYGILLHLVDYKYRTKTICSLAVNKNGMAIKYVPFNELNKQICLDAINECICAFHILYDIERYKHKVPKFLHDENFKKKCCSIIKSKPFVLDIVKSNAFKNMILLNNNKPININQDSHLLLI